MLSRCDRTGVWLPHRVEPDAQLITGPRLGNTKPKESLYHRLGHETNSGHHHHLCISILLVDRDALGLTGGGDLLVQYWAMCFHLPDTGAPLAPACPGIDPVVTPSITARLGALDAAISFAWSMGHEAIFLHPGAN